MLQRLPIAPTAQLLVLVSGPMIRISNLFTLYQDLSEISSSNW